MTTTTSCYLGMLRRTVMLAMVAFCLGLGLSVPATAQQGDGCPNWECEGGTECKLNTGGDTGCVIDGAKCKTKGCAA
jgi:hypothetical protein